MENMARHICYSVGEFPFVYLGLPVGANMRRVSTWRPVVEKIKKWLSQWRANTMSFGGRLTLIKSVLGSLLLYYFSMFHVPSCVINQLESIRRDFFWWVEWEQKNVIGQMGQFSFFIWVDIGSLRAKVWALIGKWWGCF